MKCLPTVGVALLALGLTAEAVAQTSCIVVRPLRASASQRAGLPGRLVADQQVSLRARVTGYVTAVPVDHGSKVKLNDPLVLLDVPELVAEVEMAKAALAEANAAVLDAEAALELSRSKVIEAAGAVTVCKAEAKLANVAAGRTRKLIEVNGATPQDLEEAEAAVEIADARGAVANAALVTARSAVKAASARIGSADARVTSRKAKLKAAMMIAGFATLKCPYQTAVVTMRYVDPGALVKMNDTVMLDVARVDRLRAEFHVPERDAVHIKPGVTKVDLRIDALTGEGATMEATVSRATSSINKANVMIVQVDIDTKEGKLLPGMFIYASILLVTEDGVLTLPANTLHLDDDGKHYVLVAADGVAKKVAVELKGDDGIRVQIEKGLTGDEQVIAAGLVEPGDAVRIAEAGK